MIWDPGQDHEDPVRVYPGSKFAEGDPAFSIVDCCNVTWYRDNASWNYTALILHNAVPTSRVIV